MSDEIIVDIRLVTDRKAQKAEASVTFETSHGELTIRRLRIIHEDGKDPWIAFPTIDYADKQTGAYRHLAILAPGARLRRAVTEAVLEEYRKL
ncbi:MAG: septation protein SpoVG family protein [Candidatus Zixiibacteriota bacterium]